MEYLSDDHLDQYREILAKTDAKFQEFAAFEKSHEQSLNDLTLCNLLGTGHFQRLSRLGVKLFQDPLDAFSLYGDDIPREVRDLLRYRQHCVCLFEIHLSGALTRLLRDREWYLSVSIGSCDGTVTLVNRSKRFVDAVPIKLDEGKVTVSSTLNVSIQGSWVGFELENVDIDVSYKIAMTCIDASMSVVCSYPLCEDFLPVFFENCYHNVDPGVFVQMENGSRENYEFTLMDVPKEKLVLQKNQKISIKSSSADSLYLLKRYFNKALSDKFVITKDCNTFKEISKLRNLRVDNVRDAEEMYTAVRELWYRMIKPK